MRTLNALLILAVAALPLSGCASGPATSLPDNPSAEEFMAAGQAEEDAGNLKHAVRFYDRLLSAHPSHPLVEEAEWHLAEVSFKREHWKSARTAYQDYHETHPMSRLGSTLR